MTDDLPSGEDEESEELILSSHSSSEEVVSHDIGSLITATTTTSMICSALDTLSNGDKYSLLFEHVSPPTILPKTYSHGCNRKFNTTWLEKYPWLRYSRKLDAVFCGPCSILLALEAHKRSNKGVLVNVPFSNWVKISDTLKKHSGHAYHREAMQSADTLKTTINNPAARIDVMASTALQSKIAENKHILQQIVCAILFLAKQGLALRDNMEKVNSPGNPGNFIAILKVFAESDSVLRTHLYQPRAKNATYMSPRIQNEILNIIGYDIICAKLIEVNNSGFFTVLADEVSSHDVEHLAICLRYVDRKYEIHEEFVKFIKMDRVRAVDITNAIVGTLILEGLGLSLNNLQGQGYDGASTMSGEKSGVQKRIRDIQPKALYTHCVSHSLNLVISGSCTCSIPEIRNAVDHIKNLTIWIKYSPKREKFLQVVYQHETSTGGSHSRHPILNVCVTRWVENIDGWEQTWHVYSNFMYSVSTCTSAF